MLRMGFLWQKKSFIFIFVSVLAFSKEMLILPDECSFTEEATLEMDLKGCVGVRKGRKAILRSGTDICGGEEG